MGEARRRRENQRQLLRRHPSCIYCGGSRAATTIEHMPPSMMFRGKQRPKGLEFPSCGPCNNGTSLSDLVASLLGRIYPDPIDSVDGADIQKMMSGVANNAPGLLEEMHIGRAGQENAWKQEEGISIDSGGGFLKIDGSLVTKHMTCFAAKLGLALYFEATQEALPLTGGIVPLWFSNVQALRGQLPSRLISILGEPKTLQQGRKSVGDQFGYAQFLAPDRSYAVFFATFRFSFATGCIVSIDRSQFAPEREDDQWPVLSPGQFYRSSRSCG